MSMTHFQSIQQMIEELAGLGFKDITDDVKRHYHPYLYICTLQRPASEQEEGPIYIAMVDQLLMLLEQVDPSRLKTQVWFCEQCQAVNCVNYRKNASPTEVIDADCQNVLPLCVISFATAVKHCQLALQASLPDLAYKKPDW